MRSLSNSRLYGREAMLRALLSAGQFAHLSVDDLSRSMDSLWDIDLRLSFLAEKDQRAAWAERAVAIALVKAAETGLMPPDYFDAETVEWVARTHDTLCCLCFGIGNAIGCPYDTPLDFVSYICPTFLRLEVPHYVRRPLCSKCSWAVAGRRWREEGQAASVAHDDNFWAAVLAHMTTLKSFRERVAASAGHMHRLRFDPRRIPQTRTA